MKLRNTHLIGLCSLGVLVLSGCIMSPPVLDTVIGLEPGTYYIEMQDGELYYYKLAETRGEDGAWVSLNLTDDWYAGPGFYELSESNDWSINENYADVTLDDYIQLHDPAPAAP